jgi:hypothetical protein
MLIKKITYELKQQTKEYEQQKMITEILYIIYYVDKKIK